MMQGRRAQVSRKQLDQLVSFFVLLRMDEPAFKVNPAERKSGVAVGADTRRTYRGRDSASDGDRVSMLFCGSPIPVSETPSAFHPRGRQNPVTLNQQIRESDFVSDVKN